MVVTVILAIAGIYQLLALAACIRRLFFREKDTGFTPGVSILKPIRGADPAFHEAIRSHAELDYPEYELLFGVADMKDSAVPSIEKLISEYPAKNIRIVQVSTKAPNGKVGSLIDLYREAKHPVILMNDSDIRVGKDYLRKVVAPLADSRIGLVTCLYNAGGATFPARFEALGVDSDFVPSTLVAPFVGVDEFALGSTIAMRREDLDRIGGFEAVADYIADDYQLGHKIHALGLKCHLAEPVVDTQLGAYSWRDAWLHQVRWARTIRVSRPDGYIGLPVTFATLWALLGFASGHFALAYCLLLARYAVAFAAGIGMLLMMLNWPVRKPSCRESGTFRDRYRRNSPNGRQTTGRRASAGARTGRGFWSAFPC